MNEVGKFEKVSFDEFYKSAQKLCLSDPKIVAWDPSIPIAEPGNYPFQRAYEMILKLPRRATRGSAGYDFVSPFAFVLKPGQSVKIPTGIRVRITPGWWLGCFPRSGLGFNFRLQLDNTVGIIDSDYYYAKNEGHIFAKITNDSRERKTLKIKAGDAFMQGVFLPYGITFGDNVREKRTGGLGSTSR